MKISCVIIAGNEESKIADAIRSADFADEVLVVDSESTDRTREIAEALGARVMVQPWLGFSKQKQFATDSAAHDWILSLDADERVSPELRASLLGLKSSEASEEDAYRMARLTPYMGRDIRHSGWYPDWQTRFYDRRKGAWSDRVIHESFKLSPGSKLGTLRGDLVHLSVDDAAQHHRMIGERYAPLAAEQMLRAGKRTSVARVMTAGAVSFLQSYVVRLGFLDGFPGFVIAKFAAHHAFLKHLILWELQNRR